MRVLTAPPRRPQEARRRPAGGLVMARLTHVAHIRPAFGRHHPLDQCPCRQTPVQTEYSPFSKTQKTDFEANLPSKQNKLFDHNKSTSKPVHPVNNGLFDHKKSRLQLIYPIKNRLFDRKNVENKNPTFRPRSRPRPTPEVGSKINAWLLEEKCSSRESTRTPSAASAGWQTL